MTFSEGYENVVACMVEEKDNKNCSGEVNLKNLGGENPTQLKNISQIVSFPHGSG